MANPEHLKILKQGVSVWNEWRKKNSKIRPDFLNAKLNGMNLGNVNFYNTNLGGAILNKANLAGAELIHAWLNQANLEGADLSHADLGSAYVGKANLSAANLSRARCVETDFDRATLSDVDFEGARLHRTNFRHAILSGANFSGVHLAYAVLTEVDLSQVTGLTEAWHQGPSSIGIDTIYRSKGNIPESFLKNAGVPADFITFMKSLEGKAIEFYTCFISYSSKDDEFAKRLHSDLQDNGVRCWFAPEDLKIGDKIRFGIDEAIRIHDKLLLILSENSINSQWVEQEVEKALEKERDENRLVLFPIRIDDSVFETKAGWAPFVKNSRNIGDFSDWKNHDSYKKAFERLLRDLKADEEILKG